MEHCFKRMFKITIFWVSLKLNKNIFFLFIVKWKYGNNFVSLLHHHAKNFYLNSFKFGNFIYYVPSPSEDLLTERKEEIGRTLFKYSVLQVTRTEQWWQIRARATRAQHVGEMEVLWQALVTHTVGISPHSCTLRASANFSRRAHTCLLSQTTSHSLRHATMDVKMYGRSVKCYFRQGGVTKTS